MNGLTNPDPLGSVPSSSDPALAVPCRVKTRMLAGPLQELECVCVCVCGGLEEEGGTGGGERRAEWRTGESYTEGRLAP